MAATFLQLIIGAINYFINIIVTELFRCANANTTAPSEPTATEQQSELVETETTQQEETNITEVATDVTTETVEKEVISDNIFDYEFIYNGKKVTLPMNFKEFSESTGWRLDELINGDMDEIMLDSMEGTGLNITNINYPGEDYTYYGDAVFVNLTDEKLHVSDASICRIYFYHSEFKESWEEIELSKGITWGSTVEEILEAYGEECYIEEKDDGSARIFYRDPSSKGGEYKALELYVDDEYGLCAFEYSNQKDMDWYR